MIEIRIHGRGGQGGVTLAKVIATTRFLQGDSVQAFGLYAAERAGAPIQAFCRFSAEPITRRTPITEPDHIILLDPTLASLGVTQGLKAGGWVLVNSPDTPEALAKQFPGYRVAAVDATEIARTHELGTRALPIVNTALAGAVGRMLDMPLEWVEAGLTHLGFIGPNLGAARDAYAATRLGAQPVAAPALDAPAPKLDRIPGLVTGNTGATPKVRTGNWATQRPVRHGQTPPCNDVCPAGNDVQGFLHALADKDVNRALEILLETSPLPGVCGRVCQGPCMEACNRISYDEGVNVRGLERFASDHGHIELRPPPAREEQVAVVGSGPGGLSAAYHLARLGYAVTLHEAEGQLGGLLRTGIPEYRLPDAALDRDLTRILMLGVKVQVNDRVDRARLTELTKSSDAVLVATGLQHLRPMDLGEVPPWSVVQGIDFLAQAHEGQAVVEGLRVAVVGGGNTAFDAARTAVRLGAASVDVVYRRTRAEMPAIPEEIEEALEEGVKLSCLELPVAFVPGRLTCRSMKLGANDASGRPRPVEVLGSEHDIMCDLVILALGQSPELSLFPEGARVSVSAERQPVAAPMSAPIYAVGDVATQAGTVSAAIGSGRRAAYALHERFTGERLAAAVHDPDGVIHPDRMHMHLFEHAARHGDRVQPIEARTYTEEVHMGLEDASEAARCLSCGVCNQCGRCVTYCPEGVLVLKEGQVAFDYDYCKGCGVCAAECPRGGIVMERL
ncbi:MAG: 2-oxoacid:acceptor oxidoreductase family protein [Deltaproteobacteria bacterium]|nr:2-oxoacid:acceptor oxidoreductase family protein [Deltaproteobacteria bacterium]